MKRFVLLIVALVCRRRRGPGGGAGRAARRRDRHGARRPRRGRVAARAPARRATASTAGPAPATVTTPLMDEPADAARTSIVAGELHRHRRRQRHDVLLRRAGDHRRRRVGELAHRAGRRRAPRTCAGGNVVTRENCRPGDTDWNVGLAAGVRRVRDRAERQPRAARSTSRSRRPAPRPSTSRSSAAATTAARARGCSRRSRPCPWRRSRAASNDAEPRPAATAPTGPSRQTITTTATWPSGVYLIRVDAQRHRRPTPTCCSSSATTRATPTCSTASRRRPTRRTTTTAASRSTTTTRPAPTTVAGTARAVKVSFDRPYEQQHDAIAHDWYTRTDFATVAWLERSGYDVSYNAVLGPRALRRASVRDHRVVHLRRARRVLLGRDAHGARAGARRAAPTCSSPAPTRSTGRSASSRAPSSGARIACWSVYKTTQSGGADPSGIPTGTWRDPAGANQPENALTGVMYVGQKDFTYFPMKVTRRPGAGPHLALHRPRHAGRRRDRDASAPACSAGSGTRASTTAPSPPGVVDARRVARHRRHPAGRRHASTRPARRCRT